MTVRDAPWPAGTPCWVDLTSTDPGAARSFYAELFGWQLELGDADTYGYTLARVDGHTVAGISGVPAQGSHPAFWATYLATEDLDVSVEQVRAAGGRVQFGPIDVLDKGRMALVETPGGGFVGLWQAGTLLGFELANDAGAVTWNEFMTRDVAAATRFYADVFGYTYTDIGAGFDYRTAEVGGRTVGGVGVLPDAVPAHVPPHWRVYFSVADCDTAVARAVDLGATVLRPAADMPYGRHADIADPQGAMFSVITPPAGG